MGRLLGTTETRTLLVLLFLLALTSRSILVIVARPLDSLEPDLQITYYDLLSVQPSDDAKVLKKAYRAAALLYHPDRFVDRIDEQEVASAKFVLIAEAYDVLSDTQKRKEYDLLVEHGHYKYDPRVYAEIMNDKNRAWGHRAGFTFTSRRNKNGEEMDDTWMLYLGGVFTFIVLSIPIYQWAQRRSKSAAKKEAGSLLLKQSLFENKRVLEERLASMEQAKAANSNNEEDGKEEEEDQNQDATGSKSTLTAEQIAEREERRAAKVQYKKLKLLFKSLLKPLVVEVVPVGDSMTAVSSSSSTKKNSSFASSLPPSRLSPADVDLLSNLPLEMLSELVDRIWPFLGKNSEATTVANDDATLSAAYRNLEKPLESLRSEAKAMADLQAERQRQSEQRLKEAQTKGQRMAANGKTADKKVVIEWSPAELSALAKGTAKYPGGVNDRWEKITSYVNQVVGSTRSLKEVITKSREADAAPLKKNDATAFGVYLEKLKGKTETTNEMPIGLATISLPSSSLPSLPAAPKKCSLVVSSSAASPAASDSAASVLSADEPVDGWTPVQQSQLESALRTVPKTAEDRWGDIAALVPGKTKKQVIARFKLIKAQIMAQTAK